ncbi:MAG: phenylalanine--tRNA ligase subunit beta [Nanoarchaeota archaeon]|nr:phenylalanine--tRNA ligase subunit beta [Nanoarchaeota archaeon]
MATVKISKKLIAQCVKLTPDLAERISLMGIPVESENAEEIEIEVLPNRPDVLSIQGFLRVLKAYSGKEPGLKKYKVNAPEKNYKVKVDSSLKDIRPYTCCAIVKNLKFDDSKIKEIIDLQEKLHTTLGRNRKKLAIGIYPLEKITLPIRFEARKPQDIKFRPLEMDRDLTGLEILQKHPAGRTYSDLMKNLDRYPVFVDAMGKILSMPPIINSHETGKITPETREVFIECSGSNLESLKKTLNIIVTTLADMGGKIFSMEVDYGKKEIMPDLSPDKMKLSIDNVNALLGLKLKEGDLQKLLPKVGYDYSKGKVSIPAWRTDILHEVDIIEDVAIAYGYDKFEYTIPKVATIAEESPMTKIQSKISQALAGLGLLEISTYHLIKEEECVKAKLKDEQKIELENSKTEYKLLRPNLTLPALRILSENKDNEYPHKIFEIGTVFSLDRNQNSETGIREMESLVIACSPSNFTELKQILDYLTRAFALNYELREVKKEGFIEGRTGSIFTDKRECGFIGEAHPDMLKQWGIKMPVCMIEISIGEMFKA